MTESINSEAQPIYSSRANNENEILRKAREIISNRFVRGTEITSLEKSVEYLVDYFNGGVNPLKREVFIVIWLDTRHRIIEINDLFLGTLDGVSVHPREVVREALTCNAAAAIFSHNHPSGSPEPSNDDIQITRRLKDALALVDVRVLDHIIIGGTQSVSLADRGKL